jgi:4-hydroxy-tetrahydrodipicolinate synthase
MPTAPADSTYGTTLVPTVTPFSNGSVDAEALAVLCRFLLENGADGLVPCGTTGEFASLSDAEYGTVVTTAVDAADGAPVLAGAGATSVAGTVDRIDRAADCGADAALVVLPYFHGANDPAGDERFVREVLSATSLPVLLYNIPACVGRAIDADLVAAVADHPDLVGMKDSSGDMTYFLDLVRRTGGEFHLYQGFDSQLVPAVSMGATGGINALTNVIPEATAAAVDAAVAGERERAGRLQLDHVAPLFEACLDGGFAPAAKAGLVARGVLDDGAVRPPLVELGAAAAATVETAVERTVDALAD